MGDAPASDANRLPAEQPSSRDAFSAEEPDRPPSPPPAVACASPPDVVPHVLWTRGAQCQVLADVLSGGSAIQAGSNVATSCVQTRASILVARHLTSFDLCNIAVPHGFSPTETSSIVAAVGGGPHSRLATTLAYVLGRQLELPVRAVYGHRDAGERARALAVLDDLAGHLQDVDAEAIQTPSPAAMVSELPAGSLLVVGAPGGSWFQRQFFGPGARIRAKAPGGAIVVRHAPPRVYQVMQPPTAFGPHMRVADALTLADTQQLIIAEEGRLVGLVPREKLVEAGRALELQDIMESPVFLSPEEELDHATELTSDHPGRAIPVIDSRRHIIGTISGADLTARPPL
jgi:CBS domain-containing protein